VSFQRRFRENRKAAVTSAAAAAAVSLSARVGLLGGIGTPCLRFPNFRRAVDPAEAAAVRGRIPLRARERKCLKNGRNGRSFTGQKEFRIGRRVAWAIQNRILSSVPGRPAGIPTAENGVGPAHSGKANDLSLPMNRNATTNRFLARTSRPHHTDGEGNLRDFHALERFLPAARPDFGQVSSGLVGSAVSTGPRRRSEPREGA